jgi:hypothetical protein
MSEMRKFANGSYVTREEAYIKGWDWVDICLRSTPIGVAA